jgi:small-conductance mechanosensitive channel
MEVFDFNCVPCFCIVCALSYYGYTVRRRVGTALFSVLVLFLLLLLLAVCALKLAQGDALQLAAKQLRGAGAGAGKSKQRSQPTTFTGGLRLAAKSAKAQL